MSLTSSMKNIIIDIHNDAEQILNLITELENNYDMTDMLKENKDVIFLKNLMKEKLFLGLNCDIQNLDKKVQDEINEVFPLW